MLTHNNKITFNLTIAEIRIIISKQFNNLHQTMETILTYNIKVYNINFTLYYSM